MSLRLILSAVRSCVAKYGEQITDTPDAGRASRHLKTAGC